MGETLARFFFHLIVSIHAPREGARWVDFRFFLKFKKVRANTTEKLDSFLPGMTEYMIARTIYFDRLFLDALQQQTPQIVLLGAGYDTRPYRFAGSNQGTSIFELDSPPTQDRKVRCLKKARIRTPESVTFVPIDFNRQDLGVVLERAGYRKDRASLFLWEGVSYYLEAGAVDRTLQFVRGTSGNKSRIVFDYTVTITEAYLQEGYGVKEFVQSMKEHHGDETLMFSIKEGEIGTFLAQRGLELIQHLDNKEIEAAFLKKEDGTLLGPMTEHFRFVVASPR